MKTVDITREVKARLGECPNCERPSLEQINSYKIRCQLCGYTFKVESQAERYFSIGFLCSILTFVIGYVIGLAIS